jgi:hypothetical protein
MLQENFRCHSAPPYICRHTFDIILLYGKSVKVSNPLASPGEALYLFCSKTAYHNDFFFDYWNVCLAKTFSLVGPFYDFTSVKDLEDVLAAIVQRYAVYITNYDSILTYNYLLIIHYF